MEWLSRVVPGYGPDGSPILSVLAKRTYRFANGKPAAIDAEEQIPFLEADEYWGQGQPEHDPVRLESDVVAYKPMTDVIFIGKAHAPKGKQAYYLDVGIQVGTARQLVRVIGDRKAYVTGSGLAFTEPEPFAEMPLDAGRAYGGKDEKSDEGIVYVYPKNPVGKGFTVKNHPKAVQDLALPNLEDPRKLLTPQNLALGRFDRWKEWPDPVGLGCRGKQSYPRYTLSGLPPEQWPEADTAARRAVKQAPEMGTRPSAQSAGPPRLNPAFYNAAVPGLCFPPLRGDEAVKLAYLDPEAPQFSFALPGERPRAWLDVGEGPEDMHMALHTAVIYKETNQLTMVWRGFTRYQGLEAMKDFTLFEFGIHEA